MNNPAEKDALLVFTSSLPRFPEDYFGSFVLDLASEIQARLPQVRVIGAAADDQKILEAFDAQQNITILRYRYFWPRRWQCLCYDPGGIAENFRSSWILKCQFIFFFLSQMVALWKVGKAYRIKAINAHFLVTQGFVAALYKLCHPEVRHVLTLHAAGVYAAKRLFFGRALAKFILRYSDEVFCVSHALKQELDDLIKEDSRASVLSMGIPWERIQTARANRRNQQASMGGSSRKSDRVCFLFVGRFVPKKGILTLLRVFAKVGKIRKGLHLTLVGSGPLEEEAKEFVKAEGLEASVAFQGRLPREKIYKLYSQADFLLMPSRKDAQGQGEGLPVVLLEALAHGLPVLASCHSGISELIQDGENGYLFDPDNEDEMAQTLINAVQESSWHVLSEKARASVEGYDWKTVSSKYASVLFRERDISSVDRQSL